MKIEHNNNHWPELNILCDAVAGSWWAGISMMELVAIATDIHV